MVHSAVLFSLAASMSIRSGKASSLSEELAKRSTVDASEDAKVERLERAYAKKEGGSSSGDLQYYYAAAEAYQPSTDGVELPDRDDFHYYAPEGWPLPDGDDHVVPKKLQWMFNNCPNYANGPFACEHWCSSPQVFYVRMCESHVGGACSEPWCEETAKKIQAEYPLCRCPDWPSWKRTFSQMSEEDKK